MTMTVGPWAKHHMAGNVSILLVEDDFRTTVTVARVFRELGLLDSLVISMDCGHALARLHDPRVYRPNLILLDLDMSAGSAADMLKTLKADPVSSLIPVVVLAQTNSAEEVSDCYALGAAGYMLKSDDPDVLLEKIKAVCSYWAISRLPATS